MNNDDITTEMWVRCGGCDHQWVALYMPMEMAKAGKIMERLICPKCAQDTDGIFMCKVPEVPK